MGRIQRELAHNEAIYEDALKYWGWNSKAGRYRIARRVESFYHYGAMQDLEEGDQVLEIGCGLGIFSSRMAEKKLPLVVGDLFYPFVKQCRENIHDRQQSTNYTVYDAEHLPFAGNSFGAIFGNSVLHHMPVLSVLKECHRVMQEGARIVFSEPNMANPQIAVQKNVPFVKKLAGDSPDETAFFKNQLKRYFVEAGFSDVVVVNWDFLHPSIPDVFSDSMKSVAQWMERAPLIKGISGSLFVHAVKGRSEPLPQPEDEMVVLA